MIVFIVVLVVVMLVIIVMVWFLMNFVFWMGEVSFSEIFGLFGFILLLVFRVIVFCSRFSLSILLIFKVRLMFVFGSSCVFI